MALATVFSGALATSAHAGPEPRFGGHSVKAFASFASLPASRPPKLGTVHMHWYRWHPSVRALLARTPEFGSTVVLGLRSMHDLASVRADYGLDGVRAIPMLHAAEVRVGARQLHALLAGAPGDPRLRYVSPVGPPRHVMSMPNDPLVGTVDDSTNLPYEWQFAAAHVDRALDFSKGDPAIVVGTIDTGVAVVPDLAGKVDGRWGLASDGTPIAESAGGNDYIGHGTAVASLIAANVDDRFGMSGFGGAAHVIAFRAGGLNGFRDTSIAIALTKLVSLGVRIVNMSLGGRLPSAPILVDAIHNAAAADVLLVAAVGNEASGDVSWPAATLQPSGGRRGFGLAVGATDMEGNPADFSNAGTHLSLVAPGNYRGTCSGVLVALPAASVWDDSCQPKWIGPGDARYAYLWGTSFAAPEVAGIAALVWAARPQLMNYQVADILKQSARRNSASGWTPTMGCGQLDAGAALELATSRPAAAWAEEESVGGAVCSAAGDQTPAWPAEANQRIAFGRLADKTAGDPDFAVSATASSGLPVSFTAGGQCTVSRVIVRIAGVGSCTITASQHGDADYNLAPDVSQTFSIAATKWSVRAIAESGHWGSVVRLRFRVNAERADVAATVVVRRDGASVAHRARSFSRVEPGHVYAFRWQAPRAATIGVFDFCVTLSDRIGNSSARSCSRIGLVRRLSP